jgi:polyhydroxybutyrate depolymerase
MKHILCKLAFKMLVGVFMGSLFMPTYAEDGPIRQRLKERWLQKAQQKDAPEANADTKDPIAKQGDYLFKIEHDGLTRMYRVHVPAKYDPASAAPLLFAFHGGGGNMEFQANDTNYGLVTLSEKEGAIVVFPNGTSKLKSGMFATWNAGNCCGDARDNKVDDVGFVRKIVANLTHQMNIDKNRIYATGMSNGAMMSYRLACEMPDVFTGIAAVAGTDNTQLCHPAKPISILHIHAKNDSMVLFTGGAGPDSRYKEAVTNFTSVPDTLTKWVRLNACSPTPRRILEKEGAYCDVYESCKGNAQVQLCVTEAGGHSWPGGVKRRGKEPASQAISANEVMWEFFKQK